MQPHDRQAAVSSNPVKGRFEPGNSEGAGQGARWFHRRRSPSEAHKQRQLLTRQPGAEERAGSGVELRGRRL